MSLIKVCGQTYTSRSGEVLACTAPIGHIETETCDPRRFYHSWEWLRRIEEEAEAEVVAPEEVVETLGRPEIGDLIDGIYEGDYDPYIESLLAALHGRKRGIRNVPHPYGRTDE